MFRKQEGRGINGQQLQYGHVLRKSTEKPICSFLCSCCRTSGSCMFTIKPLMLFITFAELSSGFQYTAMALCATSSMHPTRPTLFFVSEKYNAINILIIKLGLNLQT